MNKKLLPTLLLPFLLLTTARADSPTPLSPADQFTFLTPYLNDSTFMVIHIDTALIDTAALEKFAQSFAPAFNDPAAAQHITDARTLTDTFLARFHQLGGRHIYLLSYLDSDGDPQPPILLLPLESPAADPEQKPFIALLSTLPDFPPAVQINNSLFAIDLNTDTDTTTTQPTTQPTLADKLKSLIPSPRPDLQKALAASTGAAQFLVAPGTAARKILTDNLPTLPPELGGGPSDILAKHFQYLLISLTPPPAANLSITFQSDSPENASATLDIIKAAFKENAEHDATHIDLAPLFPLAVQNDTVALTLDQPALQKTFNTLIPPFLTARNQARQMVSMANMHSTLMFANIYAAQNNDAWPPTLHTLVEQKLLPDDKSFINPNDPKHRPYIYHYYSPDEIKKLAPSSTPVIWEDTDDDTTPLNVGFLDGHVEKLNSKSDLTKLLSAANENLKAP